jgi:hypothetical protein
MVPIGIAERFVCLAYAIIEQHESPVDPISQFGDVRELGARVEE